MEHALFQIDSLFWLFGALLYIIVMRRLDRFPSRRKPESEAEFLARLAHQYRVSEHDLFFYAAQPWSRPEKRVKADFRNYLITGALPSYVRDFLRREKNRPENP